MSFTVTQLDKPGIVFELNGASNLQVDEKITLVANNSVVASGQHTERWTQVVDGSTDNYEITVPNLALFSSETLIVRISGPNMTALTQTLTAKSLPPVPTVVAASGNNAIYLTVTNVGEGPMDEANTMITLQSSTDYLTYSANDVEVTGSAADGYLLKITGLTNDAQYEAAVSYANAIGESPFSTTVTASASAAPPGVTSVDYDSSSNLVSIEVPEIDVSGNGITALSLKLTNGTTTSTVNLLPDGDVLNTAGKLESATYTVQSTLAAGETETVQAYLVASYTNIQDVPTHSSNWKSEVCENDTLPMTLRFDVSSVDIFTGEQVFTVTVDAKDVSNNTDPTSMLTISTVDVCGNPFTSNIDKIDTTWNGNNVTATVTINSYDGYYLKGVFERANRDGKAANERRVSVTLSDPIMLYKLNDEPPVASLFSDNGKPADYATAYEINDDNIITDLSNGLYTINVELDGVTKPVDASGAVQFDAPVGGWVEGQIYYPRYTVTKQIDSVSALYSGHVTVGSYELTPVQLNSFIFETSSKINTVKFVASRSGDDVNFNKVLLSGENNGASKHTIRMIYANSENLNLTDLSFGDGYDGFNEMNGTSVDVFTDVSFNLVEPVYVEDNDNGNVIFVVIQDDVSRLDDIKVVSTLDTDALQIHVAKRAAANASNNLAANASSITTISGELDTLTSALSTETANLESKVDTLSNSTSAFTLAQQAVVDASGEIDVLIQERLNLDYDIALYDGELTRLTNVYEARARDYDSTSDEVINAKTAKEKFPEYWLAKTESPPLASRITDRMSLSDMITRIQEIGSIPGFSDESYTMTGSEYSTKTDALTNAIADLATKAEAEVADKTAYDDAVVAKNTAQTNFDNKKLELDTVMGETAGLQSAKDNAVAAFDALLPPQQD